LATESTKKKPFQVLALSGGGYLGLYASEILARLEDRAGRPIGSCFDLIAGTSVGGVLAAGIALDVPASRMRDLFIERGQDIFSGRRRPRFGWIDAGRSLLVRNTMAKLCGALSPKSLATKPRWLPVNTA
jgi:patatin-like phospholipase/acyl hydrolase